MQIVKVRQNLLFVNVGEDPPHPPIGSRWVGRRQWKACVEYGFLSAGQGSIYSRPLYQVQRDDIVAAYISGAGYVGIGIVTQDAVRINDFKYNGQSIANLPYVKAALFENADNDNSEVVIGIDWISVVNKYNAYWETNSGLFANQSIQCSLKDQLRTIQFLETSFNIKFEST